MINQLHQEQPAHSPAAFWDERYAAPSYPYGTAPHVFLAGQLAQLPVGAQLLPAEGEGRNAVWAAQRGREVMSTDFGAEARREALALAAAHSVSIHSTVSAVEQYSFRKPPSTPLL